ncbi:unnamed protein product [Leuciscus chuanchicus]
MSDIVVVTHPQRKGFGQIRDALPERYRKYLTFLHSFSGCDTVSAISGFSKPTLLTKLCKTDKAEGAMDVFNDIRAKKTHIPPEDFEDLRFDIISKLAAAGSIKPEKLPPTTGAAAQHFLRAYLQTRDRLLLQSPSLDVLEYGWKQGEQGYAPVPTTDPIALNYLLKFVSCNCAGTNINQPDDNRSEGDVGELDEDEAAAHLKLENIEKAYDVVFIRNVKQKHTRARKYFSQIPAMAECLHDVEIQPGALGKLLVSKPISKATK